MEKPNDVSHEPEEHHTKMEAWHFFADVSISFQVPDDVKDCAYELCNQYDQLANDGKSISGGDSTTHILLTFVCVIQDDHVEEEEDSNA